MKNSKRLIEHLAQYLLVLAASHTSSPGNTDLCRLRASTRQQKYSARWMGLYFAKQVATTQDTLKLAFASPSLSGLDLDIPEHAVPLFTGTQHGFNESGSTFPYAKPIRAVQQCKKAKIECIMNGCISVSQSFS